VKWPVIANYDVFVHSGSSLLHMIKLLSVALLMVVVVAAPIRVGANTCTAKRIKTKQVCGVVLGGSVPLQGAIVQIVSAEGKPLSESVVTNADGQFSLPDAPEGESDLFVSAEKHDTIRWPLKVTGKQKKGACERPLNVHLAWQSGWGCGSWVAAK
jgi:hypothetical protein